MTTVAIIEDNEEYGLILKDIIATDSKFSVEQHFGSAETALLDPSLCKVDLLIVDIRLPGMSGIELIRKLKNKASSHQLYLICSTHHDNDSVFQALKAGASGYLLKDSSQAQILQALNDLVAGGAPMSPYIAKKIITTFHEPNQNPSNGLSTREEEIMSFLTAGLSYQQIAEKLFISVQTVKTHIKNIYTKLHVNNKVQAINKLNFK